ncbi:rRNA-binding ribosome biosynthesis protein utp25 [Puttea exsequens]|nr:rRNA-binding ribosome biosynthesis protein utp25 [Puttea exsequens]
MAPIFRGRRAPQGNLRGGSQTSSRRRVIDRGRNNHKIQAGKNTFYSTRVEEQPIKNAAIHDERLSENGTESVEEKSEPQSDSENETDQHSAQPYSALLQSLNVYEHSAEPARKKRKVDVTGNEGRQQVEDDQDYDEERQGDEDPSIEDADFDLDDEDNIESNLDPFCQHFEGLSDEVLQRKIQAVTDKDWSIERSAKHPRWSYSLHVPAASGPEPTPSHKRISGLSDLPLKNRLKGSAGKILQTFEHLSADLASAVFKYRDILFPLRTLDNAYVIRKLTCLHTLNHVFKTRDRVIKNNARLSKDDINTDMELRDQGFTRPKILFLLPTRKTCVEYVNIIIALCMPKQQENKKRYLETYSSKDQTSESKPEDFRDLFAGNDDDMFRLGLKFTRKTVKFFAQFYDSDVIFASPLGLRMVLGADDPKKQDNDFLSSIEVIIVDQAEALHMQNWEHVEYIFDHLNLQPKEAHGCDFSRVKEWYLDGKAKYLRQTILLSSFNFPSLNKLYSQSMLNVTGKLKYSAVHQGVMMDLGISLKQNFSRFDFKTPMEEPDNRFKYFTSVIVPSLTKPKHSRGGGQSTLIFLPSYADFVRVRNYLASSSDTRNVSFGSISEYTSAKEVARARSHFSSGRHSVLLYTERAHHFKRYHLKGVKKIIMYGLPDNPIFYKEIVGGYLGASVRSAQLNIREASVRALFSRLDILKLERTVGSDRYVAMLKETRGDMFDFV